MLLNLVPKLDFVWIVSCTWSNNTILLLMFVAEKMLLLLVISLTAKFNCSCTFHEYNLVEFSAWINNHKHYLMWYVITGPYTRIRMPTHQASKAVLLNSSLNAVWMSNHNLLFGEMWSVTHALISMVISKNTFYHIDWLPDKGDEWAFELFYNIPVAKFILTIEVPWAFKRSCRSF